MNYSIDKDANRTLTLVLYVLYIIAIFSGGLLAVVALIINYVKRSDVRGSIFASWDCEPCGIVRAARSVR